LKQLRFIFKRSEKTNKHHLMMQKNTQHNIGAGFQRGRVFGDRGRGLIQSGGS